MIKKYREESIFRMPTSSKPATFEQLINIPYLLQYFKCTCNQTGEADKAAGELQVHVSKKIENEIKLKLKEMFKIFDEVDEHGMSSRKWLKELGEESIEFDINPPTPEDLEWDYSRLKSRLCDKSVQALSEELRSNLKKYNSQLYFGVPIQYFFLILQNDPNFPKDIIIPRERVPSLDRNTLTYKWTLKPKNEDNEFKCSEIKFKQKINLETGKFNFELI